MNKSLKAFMLGYVLFDVNGIKYLRYVDAQDASDIISGNQCFKGFNVFKWAWNVFYIRRGSHIVLDRI